MTLKVYCHFQDIIMKATSFCLNKSYTSFHWELKKFNKKLKKESSKRVSSNGSIREVRTRIVKSKRDFIDVLGVLTFVTALQSHLA